MNATDKSIVFIQTQAENAGAQEVSRQLAHGVAAKGWRARQIFLYRRTDAFDMEPDVFFCARERPSSIGGVFQTLHRLYAELRRDRPAAVIMFQHYGNIIAAPIARLAGVRLIVANQVSAPQSISAAVGMADKALGVLGFYDDIVVNSTVTEVAYKRYPAPYARRLLRIDHGFHDKSAPIAKRPARQKLGLPESVQLLGCAARLHPMKHLDAAIRILPLNTNQHLALAGQGPERERLGALAAELGVGERVHFVGELDSGDMGAFLAALDCFVFPSGAETFGLAPVEAAQAGLPVIANGLQVLRDVLAVDGKPCAIFVDAHDANAFAAAVREVFDDPVLYDELSARGRQMTERYPLDKMVDAYLQLINPKSA